MRYLLWLWILVFGVSSAHAEQVVPRAFGLNIGAIDASKLKLALNSVIGSSPYAGTAVGPMVAEWPFGQLVIENIHYSFSLSADRVAFQDRTLRLNARAMNLTSRIKQLTFSEDGSSVCTDIQIDSADQPIPIALGIAAEVDSEGLLKLDLYDARATLTEQNFRVLGVGECHGFWGFGWIVKRALPYMIAQYRDTIAEQAAASAAKILRDRGIEYSPYLALNLTMPVQNSATKPFYAKISINPSELTLNARQFAAWFSTVLSFDPDFSLSSEEAHSWPQNETFIGVSWKFMNAALKEIEQKNILFGVIDEALYPNHWQSVSQWIRVWPELANTGTSSKLTYRLKGVQRAAWTPETIHKGHIQLFVEGLRLQILMEDQLVAAFNIDCSMQMRLETNQKSPRTIETGLTTVSFQAVSIDTSQGTMAQRPWNKEGLAHNLTQLISDIEALPWTQRRLLSFQLPDLRIGAYELSAKGAQLHSEGVLIPLDFSRTSNAP